MICSFFKVLLYNLSNAGFTKFAVLSCRPPLLSVAKIVISISLAMTGCQALLCFNLLFLAGQRRHPNLSMLYDTVGKTI
jgi:hypothetical protein